MGLPHGVVISNRGCIERMSLRMESSIADRDRRRPYGWDWVLALFLPMQAIAYHHHRAGMKLAHVFVLLLACTVCQFVNSALMIFYFSAFMERLVSCSGLTPSTTKFSEAFKIALDYLSSLSQKEREARIKLVFKELPQSEIMNQLTNVSRLFSWFLIALAFYLVWAAWVGTKRARRELAESSLISGHPTLPSSAFHPLLSTPKGSGPAFMAYAIAIMSPGASYAIHSDRRWISVCVTFLSNALISTCAFYVGALVALPSSGDNLDKDVLATAGRVLLGLFLVPLALYLLGPLRCAINNVRDARQKYAKTLALE
jgi:hypothetical protein